MSSRVSGHSDRPRMAVRAALLLTVLGLVAGPIAPLASAASGGGITLTTPFPSIVVEPGSTATFQLSLDVNAEQDVKLALQGAPADWTTRFEGDNLTIDSAFVTPAKAVEVTLSLAVPDSAQDASQSLRVTATGKDGTVTLPLTLRVQAKVGGEVTLTTDTAEKTGPASTTFTFSLTLKNGTAQDQTFSFDAQGPDPSWTVSAKPAAEAQAVSTLVKAGASTSVTVTAQAPDGVEAGTYPITVTASGAGEPVTTSRRAGLARAVHQRWATAARIRHPVARYMGRSTPLSVPARTAWVQMRRNATTENRCSRSHQPLGSSLVHFAETAVRTRAYVPTVPTATAGGR